MNLLRLALYEVTYYGPIFWFGCIAITFLASRYLGWPGALLSPLVVAAIVVVLDVNWIWDQMRNHPENGRDADMIFFFGLLCRVLLFNLMLVPVGLLGLWMRYRRRIQVAQ